MKNQKKMPAGRQGFTPILVLLATIVIGVFSYFFYKNYSIQKSLDSDGTQVKKLGDVEFQVPQSFYIRYSKNPNYPIEVYDIDPDKNININEKIPNLLFRLDVEKATLKDKEKSLIATWHLLDIVEKSVIIAGKDVIIFTARVNPVNNYNSRFKDNAKVKFGIFIVGDKVYHLLSDISESGSEKVFDQILSTFKFTK